MTIQQHRHQEHSEVIQVQKIVKKIRVCTLKSNILQFHDPLVPLAHQQQCQFICHQQVCQTEAYKQGFHPLKPFIKLSPTISMKQPHIYRMIDK